MYSTNGKQVNCNVHRLSYHRHSLGVHLPYAGAMMIKYLPSARLSFVAVLFITALLTLGPAYSQSTLTYDVSREGTTSTYHAVSRTTPSAYTGTLKFVVESAVSALSMSGGGSIL